MWTRYGPPAHQALAATLARLKAADPLAPVTVLVPTNLSGVIARRALARGLPALPGPPVRAGVVGLSVLTVDRLAERLAAPALAGSGRRPVTTAVLAAAWRQALARDPGVFAPVAAHPATVRALVRAHRELRDADPEVLTRLSGADDPVTTDLIRLHHAVIAGLVDWYDPADLRLAAIRAVRGDPRAVGEIGAVVAFLPQALPPASRALLREISAGLTVIAGHSGEPRADAEVVDTVRQLSEEDGPPAAGERAPRRVRHASDADDEIRCLIRDLIPALRVTPPNRIAILYGAANPYARLLAEHLQGAGIRWNGAPVGATVDRTVARTLLDLLALPARGWRRAEVMAVLSAAPILDHDGSRVPAARWERISRIAGVVGNGDWDTRLKAYAAQERRAADEERAQPEPRLSLIARRERDAAAAHGLREFMAGLRNRLHHGASLRRWSDLSAWAADLFTALLGDDGSRLPVEEERAAGAVRRILAGLAGLDTVDDGADLAAFRLTLDLELSDDLPRHGRFGDGVLVAPLAAAIGLDADRVFVVGVCEDLVPGRARADALLPDDLRALAGGLLPLARNRIDRTHRHLLAAFDAAPDCLVSYPRGDLRQSTNRHPSRWLEYTVEESSPSFAASLARADLPATEQEWRTRRAVSAHSHHEPLIRALAGDPVIARSLALRAARDTGLVTRFDGDLSGCEVPDPTGGTVLSPTALESWVRCPHAYFVERMLGIQPVESPEELVQISPLEVGNLIHSTVDRFFAGEAAAGTVPDSGTPWSTGHRDRLRAIALDVAADLATRGATGHPVLWRQELARILTDLDHLLTDDDEVRSGNGRRQVRSELAFGTRDTDPVTITLPAGRVLRLRGSADRVDRSPTGVVVVDYKTGSAYSFGALTADNPTANGSKLQLPIYAYAARAALGTAEVSAEYWFVRRNRGQRVQLALTPAVERTYHEVLQVIADGIRSGLFPHRPPAQDGRTDHIECRYCDPDGLGVTDHRSRWHRKRHDPRLAGYVALIGDDHAG